MNGYLKSGDESHHIRLKTEKEGKLMGAMIFINALRASQRREEIERKIERKNTNRDESLYVKIQSSKLAYLNLITSEKITKFAVLEATMRVTNPYGSRNLTIGYSKRFLRREDISYLIKERTAQDENSLPMVDLDEIW